MKDHSLRIPLTTTTALQRGLVACASKVVFSPCHMSRSHKNDVTILTNFDCCHTWYIVIIIRFFPKHHHHAETRKDFVEGYEPCLEYVSSVFVCRSRCCWVFCWVVLCWMRFNITSHHITHTWHLDVLAESFHMETKECLLLVQCSLLSFGVVLCITCVCEREKERGGFRPGWMLMQ